MQEKLIRAQNLLRPLYKVNTHQKKRRLWPKQSRQGDEREEKERNVKKWCRYVKRVQRLEKTIGDVEKGKLKREKNRGGSQAWPACGGGLETVLVIFLTNWQGTV